MKYMNYYIPTLLASILCTWAVCIAFDSEKMAQETKTTSFPVNVDAADYQVVAHFPIPATRVPQASSKDALYIAQGESGPENLTETFSLSYQSLSSPYLKATDVSSEELLERFILHLSLSGEIAIEPLALPSNLNSKKLEGLLRLYEVNDGDRTDYYAIRIVRIGYDGVVVAVRTIEKSVRKKQELNSPHMWGFLSSINVQELVSSAKTN